MTCALKRMKYNIMFLTFSFIRSETELARHTKKQCNGLVFFYMAHFRFRPFKKNADN